MYGFVFLAEDAHAIKMSFRGRKREKERGSEGECYTERRERRKSGDID